MKKLLTTIVFVLAFVFAKAQFSVKGTVVDNKQEPVAFAAVGLYSAGDSTVIKGAVTDVEGGFQFLDVKEGQYYVSLQYVGFKPKNTEIFTLSTQKKIVDLSKIVLEEDVKTLSEVTVTAQRPLVEQLPDRFVLNTENSIVTKGNMVNDLLQYAPLVQVDLDGAVSVANRGNVLILVDGRQMGQAALDNFLKNYSAEDILKVEVITNPSAKYDASFTSVIDITTKKSLERGLNGNLSLTYSQGEYIRFTPNVSLNYRSDKWNVFTSLSYGNRNFLRDQKIKRNYPDGNSLYNDVEAVNKNESLSSFTGVDFYPNKNHVLGLRFNGNWAETNNNGFTKSSFYSDLPAVSADSVLQTTNRGNSDVNSYDINFNYLGKLDENGKEITVNLTQTFYERNSLQNIRYARLNTETNSEVEPRLLRVDNPSKQNSFIAQADLSFPTEKAQWEVGTKYIYVGNDNELIQEEFQNGEYEVDPDFNNADMYKEHTVAAYTSYSRGLNSGWNVQLGLRAEQSYQNLDNQNVSREYFGLFPSAGINKSFKGGYNWGVSYARKILRPSLSELVPYRFVIDPYSIMEGNPALKPQYSNAIDTYLNWKSLTFFANYTRTNDMISPIMEVDTETNIYVQVTKNLELVHDAYAGINWSNQLTKWWQTNSNFMVSATSVKGSLEGVSNYESEGMGFMVSSNNIIVISDLFKGELRFNYNSANRWNVFETGEQYWFTAGLSKDVFKRGNLRVSFEDIFRTRYDRFGAEYGAVMIDGKTYKDSQRIRVSFSYNFGKQTVKEARKSRMGNEDVKGRMGGVEQ